MLTLNDGRPELWQWDTGRTLAVDADCSQVHFSNKVFGRSIDVDVIDGVAIIPDILLQTDKDLNAWAFVGTAKNGYTKISKTFKVNRRNKPADYVFTPPEQTALSELADRLDKIEESQDPEPIKNAVEDYLEQNPVEVPVQSVNGRTGEVKLTAKDLGAISQDDLQEATNNALAQAKESGEFDGEPGKDGAPGLDGQDYVLTEEDKAEIAELAAELVEIPEGCGGGIAVTGAIVGQTVKIAAVDEEGVPTAWEPVDMPSGGSVGETWEKVAEVTITEVVNSLQVTFEACKAVYIQLQWGAVENDLGRIYVTHNSTTPYIAESRDVAAEITTSATAKRGYLFVSIDARMGSCWTARSNTVTRSDGDFGNIKPGDDMNCAIGVSSNGFFSKIDDHYMDKDKKQLAGGIKLIVVKGAGMAIGTTLSVWGIKK